MKTFIHTLTLLVCLSIPACLSAQNWAHFFTDDLYSNMAVTENKIYFGLRSGLVEYDRNTGAYEVHTQLQHPNLISHIQYLGPGLGDDLWLKSIYSDNPLFYYDGNEFNSIDEFQDDFYFTSSPLIYDENGHVWLQVKTGIDSPSAVISVAPDGSYEVVIEAGVLPESINFNFGHIGSDGTVYLASSGEIFLIHPTGTELINASNAPFNNEYFDAILISSDGDIWIAQEFAAGVSNVHRYSDGMWSSYTLQDLVDTESRIYGIFEGADQSVIIGIGDGKLLTFANDTWVESAVPQNPDFPGATSYFLDIDPENNLWYWEYPGQSNRLRKYDFHSLETFTITNADINSNLLSDVRTAPDGTIWAIGNHGISYFKDAEWTNLSKSLLEYTSRVSVDGIAFGPQGQVVTAIHDYWSSGTYWLLSWDPNSESWDLFPTPDFPGDLYINNLGYDQSGALWMTTQDEYVYRFQGNDWTFYSPDLHPALEGLEAIFGLTVASNGDLWIAGYNGLVHFDGADFSFFEPDVLDGLFYHWTYIDQEGNLWVRGGDGLTKFEGLSPTVYDDSNLPLPVNQLLHMTQDAAGDFWFSFSNAICKYDGQNWTVHETPVTTTPYHLTFDTYNNLWIQTQSLGLLLFSELGITPPPAAPACIEGTVFYDVDENGVQGSAEVTLTGHEVLLHPDSTTAFVNILDSYHFDIFEFGEYEVECPYDPLDWIATTPALQVVSIEEEGCLEDVNFGLKSTIDKYAAEVFIIEPLPRCNTEGALWVGYSNTGTNIIDGELSVTIDPLLTVTDISVDPATVNGNTYTFMIEDFYPFQQEQILFSVIYPGVSNIGDVVEITAELQAWIGNQLVSLDDAASADEVICSYDPNDKTAYSTGPQVDDYVLLGDTLEYLIRFENKGNDTAFQVVIQDTLDPNLNLATFKVLGSSHPVITQLFSDHRVEFRFEDIELPYTDIDPVNSQGFVRFRIAPKDPVSPETLIENAASIYFDFNPPIHTNTTQSIFVESLPSAVKDLLGGQLDYCNFVIFPNPVKAGTHLQFEEPVAAVKLFSEAGIQVLSRTSAGIQGLQLPDQIAPGTYYGQVNTQKGLCLFKVIIY